MPIGRLARDAVLTSAVRREIARVLPHHGLVLCLGHFVHAQVKRPGDPHPVLGLFVVVGILVIVRRIPSRNSPGGTIQFDDPFRWSNSVTVAGTAGTEMFSLDGIPQFQLAILFMRCSVAHAFSFLEDVLRQCLSSPDSRAVEASGLHSWRLLRCK